MKKPRKWLATSAALFIIPALAACSSSNGSDTGKQEQPKTEMSSKANTSSDRKSDQESKKSQTQNKEMPQAQVLQAIKKDLKTKIPIKLPTQLPVDEGKHLTAITSSGDTSYQIQFYETDTPVAVNDPSVPGKRKDAVKIADMQVKKFDSVKKAQEQIGYQNYSKIGGKKMDLGHGVSGYRDAGAGSANIGWNEGRWDLVSRARTNNAKAGEQLALKTVDYLEKHTLPAPNKYGSFHLDAEDKGTSWVLWQDGDTVYNFNKVDDPMNLLAIVEEMK
ncbi:hypothetical protein QR721_03580 [Aciduricibacillus chroicocephali]|uniref:Lipoprotein n=1 Tax=Aciduricibacillus chroicocephali TaxID=3054939 RepID=A0ABY9KY51_9BACI|nr:hypothetical protein QR721_03580 [Bacillaceae bacterium 44XB]